MKVKNIFIFKIQDSDIGASIMFVVKDFVLIIRDFGGINFVKSIAVINITPLYMTCDSHGKQADPVLPVMPPHKGNGVDSQDFSVDEADRV
jgi:hypothetical protein